MTHQFIELIKKPIRSFAALFRIKISIIRKNHHTLGKQTSNFITSIQQLKIIHYAPLNVYTNSGPWLSKSKT